jgi:hypothetical protein
VTASIPQPQHPLAGEWSAYCYLDDGSVPISTEGWIAIGIPAFMLLMAAIGALYKWSLSYGFEPDSVQPPRARGASSGESVYMLMRDERPGRGMQLAEALSIEAHWKGLTAPPPRDSPRCQTPPGGSGS